MNARCASSVQPLRRLRSRGTGVKSIGSSVTSTRPVTAGSGQWGNGGNSGRSDIGPPGKKEAIQLSHDGDCRTGVSNGSFGWKADISHRPNGRNYAAHEASDRATVSHTPQAAGRF